MGDTSLIWWKSRTHGDLIQHGKIISSWVEFIFALRKQFYPLAYNQTYMIEWSHLKQLKEKNVQAYTQEFKKKTLALEIPLYTHETLLKYIEGLHYDLHHTILMFNPSNIGEVLVKATHLEASKSK
jgi:hypothetical protein